jgi:hypothetical protein
VTLLRVARVLLNFSYLTQMSKAMLEKSKISLVDIRTKVNVIYSQISCIVFEELDRFIPHGSQPNHVILAFIVAQGNTISSHSLKSPMGLVFE